MPTPPRILRADIEDIPGARPQLSPREQDRKEVILAAARRVMVIHGRAGVRLSDLATALGMAPGTIRRHFPDLDYLLGEILRYHLLAVSSAIGQARRAAPNEPAQRQAAARAAYLAATRTVLGGHTEAHVLLLRERHHLPPDQRDGIERTRDGLGEVLAPDHAAAALALLDMTELTAGQVESMLLALSQPVRNTPRLQVISRIELPAGRARPAAAAQAASARETCPAPARAHAHQPYATGDP